MINKEKIEEAFNAAIEACIKETEAGNNKTAGKFCEIAGNLFDVWDKLPPG